MPDANSPDHVKEFLATLDPSDIEVLKVMLRLFRDAQGWCRITKWVFFTVLAGALMLSNAADQTRHILRALLGLKTGQ